MIKQQDPVGLVTFDDKIQASLAPKSQRAQLGRLLSLLASLKPSGKTDVAGCMKQLASMLGHRNLIMLFSDLLVDTAPVIESLRRLRHKGHDVILFHVLDEAEVQFPFHGTVEFMETENDDRLQLDADGYREDYLEEIHAFREEYRQECFQTGIDYVPLDTSMPFDKALLEYLRNRQLRF